MLEAAKHVWYPYLHCGIVSAAQNCKSCLEKGKSLKVIAGKITKEHSTQDENKKEYILVGVDRFFRFPYAKLVSNNKADTTVCFMQNQMVNQGVPRNIQCGQAQGFRAKKFLIYCKSNNIKLLFAPVDDHRVMGIVERLIGTLKSRLSIMKIDRQNQQSI